MCRLRRRACLEHSDICCIFPLHILRAGLIWWAQVYIFQAFLSFGMCDRSLKTCYIKKGTFLGFRSGAVSVLPRYFVPSLGVWCPTLPDSVVATLQVSNFQRRMTWWIFDPRRWGHYAVPKRRVPTSRRRTKTSDVCSDLSQRTGCYDLSALLVFFSFCRHLPD